ncbi:hypothetical protein BU15DRAFT_61413 [Melanogaster broomeanus]|nr:hypothetical protein BU15DRAFT_61413 [Melanogaster broomeanus]
MYTLGLYSFTPITPWLLDSGLASPATLVAQGLTLPDSRILNGIAGIGLTLTDIASIASYLRQSMVNNIRSSDGNLALYDGTSRYTGHDQESIPDATISAVPQAQPDGSPGMVNSRPELQPDVADSASHLRPALLYGRCVEGPAKRCRQWGFSAAHPTQRASPINRKRSRSACCLQPWSLPGLQGSRRFYCSNSWDNDQVAHIALRTSLPAADALEAALPDAAYLVSEDGATISTSTPPRLGRRPSVSNDRVVRLKKRMRMSGGHVPSNAAASPDLDAPSTTFSALDADVTHRSTLLVPDEVMLSAISTPLPSSNLLEATLLSVPCWTESEEQAKNAGPPLSNSTIPRLRTRDAEPRTAAVEGREPLALRQLRKPTRWGECRTTTTKEGTAPEAHTRKDDVGRIICSSNLRDKGSHPSALGSAVTGAQANRQANPQQVEASTTYFSNPLVFIPQAVMRRHPSAPAMSKDQFGRQPFNSSRDYQTPPAPSSAVVDDQALMMESRSARTSAWAASAASEVRWRAPFLCLWEEEVEKRPVEEKTVATIAQPIREEELVIEKQLVVERQPVVERDLVPEKESAMDRRYLVKQEPRTPAGTGSHVGVRKPSSGARSGSRLGVLARAALRDRRAAARRYRSDGCDNSLSSGNDSEFESDSRSSSEPSVDEKILPETLGAALLVAIDADGALELDFRSGNTMPALDADDCSSASQDSAVDVSLIAHGPSSIDTSDTEIRVSSAPSSLNYEAIEQWASRVPPHTDKQHATNNVHRSRSVIRERPSSPSEASEACAERPTISGISQCPLHGVVHGKLLAAVLSQVQVKAPMAAAPPRQKKPWSALNLRNIPEFVPRRRPIPVSIPRHAVDSQRSRTRSMVNIASDAVGEVIARQKGWAGFNAQQWNPPE